MVGQRRDDRLGDLGDPDGLRVGGVAAARHHVEGHPRGVGHADVLRLGQLWGGTGTRSSLSAPAENPRGRVKKRILSP